MLAPRLVRHYWTDDEFNLLARCRARHWTFDRIQKTHFPSLTKRAVFLAHSRYKRFRVKEHSDRTSLADTSATTPRSISRRGELTRSNLVPESSSSSHTTPLVDNTVEASRSPISRRQNNLASATTIRTASRYNLRPSKSKSCQGLFAPGEHLSRNLSFWHRRGTLYYLLTVTSSHVLGTTA
jgi:hypothetical protein